MANLGDVLRMTDKDVNLTVSDMSFKELIENSPIQSVSNSIIISAPQDENGTSDKGYYGIFASDYNGNIVPLVPFNKIDEDQFSIIDDNGEKKLVISENYLTQFINNAVEAKFSQLLSYVGIVMNP